MNGAREEAQVAAAAAGPEGALRTAWDILRNRTGDQPQVALAIAAMFWTAIIGSVAAFLYGWTARECEPTCQGAGGLLAMLAAAASLSIGGLLGLLFGAPNWSGVVVKTDTRKDDATTDPSTGQSQPSVRPNTSLERIADWLTTMIVGLSLVHLKTIVDYAKSTGIWLTSAITLEKNTVNAMPGMAIAIFFGVVGFAIVYLWCIRFLPSELRDTFSARFEQMKDDVLRLQKAVYRIATPVMDRHDQDLKEKNVDEETRREIRRRYESASSHADEPLKDFGPAESGRYKLTATVHDEGSGVYRIEVHLTDKDAQDGYVVWLLHNTFAPDVLSTCPIKGGTASYSTIVSGSFCIGAVIPNAEKGAVSARLSLDLAQAEGATDAFRNA